MKKIGKFDALKALSIVTVGLGLALNLLNSFVEDKKVDAKITEKVNLKLAQLTTRED